MAVPPPTLQRHRVSEAQKGCTPEIPDPGANRGVANRLRKAVRAAGGNLAVARRSGIPLATINNYVRGRNGMKIEPLSALAASCNVSLDWLVSGREASASGPPAFPDFPTADAAPNGLGEAPAESPPVGIDVRILAKAIEIVAAIAGAAEFQDDPKALARRIATTYAVLIEPDAPRD